jgi:hypothetical protein
MAGCRQQAIFLKGNPMTGQQPDHTSRPNHSTGPTTPEVGLAKLGRQKEQQHGFTDN